MQTRKAPLLAGFAVLLAALIALAALTFHYSNLILLPGAPPTLREQRILSLSGGRIGLSRDRESLQPGTWALQWADGYGWVGRVIDEDRAAVLREFRPVVGVPPVGGWASLRGMSRSADPRSMLGLDFREIAFEGPLGRCPAWRVDGADLTWGLFVHGRDTNRSEGLRTLEVFSRRGLPALMIAYRNDPDAPRSPDGLSHLGLTEWQDVESAARYALANGARDLVLSGYSMGGHMVIQFMAHSALRGRVRAIVLESPVLDWNATIQTRARATGVPRFAIALGQWLAARRGGFRWEALDARRAVDRIDVPILLFHPTHDTFAPESVSETVWRANPRHVTLVRVAAGNHVEAWNADPKRYDAELDAWCSANGIGKEPSLPREASK